MDIGMFDDGVPERVTAKEFLRHHLQHFPKLAKPENLYIIENAIDDVYTMFSGVATIWNRNTKELWYKKTVECYRLLAAWYIADQYPKFLSGVPAMGGVALKSKRIADVNLGFSDTAVSNPSGNFRDTLGMLKSNPFGAKAYLMITTAAKRSKLYGSSSV